jgi:tetratricopeptide (TPR) repeat protein
MDDVTTVDGLGRLLRQLRRRQARQQGGAPATYRELAAATGWSHGIVGEYLAGRVLPPTDRFDVLVRLLGATPAEQGALATVRDRVEERRRADQQRAATPRQLPVGVSSFAGRTATLATLDRWLSDVRRNEAAAVTVLTGTAGVGKTTLAVHWTRQVVDRFPDGQLHVNLRGFDPAIPPMRPAEAIRTVLDALGAQASRIPAELDAQAALYRSLMAGRRMLILLDNAATADQVRPLLPGEPGSLVVVTSRSRLTGLVAADGAYPVPVDLLPPADARELLAGRVGADRVASESTAADRIVRTCARLPLALAVVGARLAVQPALSLTVLADRLDADRLTALDTGDPAVDVRAALSWSYLRLEPAAARVFRLLGLHPAAEAGLSAIASLAGEPVPVTRQRLADLVRVHLVGESPAERYTLHDLLHTYAAELAATGDQADAEAARIRMRDHYLHTAYAAALRLHPARRSITLPPPAPGVTVTEPTDSAAATTWFRAEGSGLRAAVHESAAEGDDRYAWRLAWTLADYQDRDGHWQDWIDTQTAAAEAAGRLNDPAWQLFAHRSTAGGAIRLRRHELAREQLERSGSLAAGLGDLVAQAQAEHALAWLCEGEEDLAEAIAHSGRAVALYESAGERGYAARARNGMGWNAALMGDYGRALTLCTEALAVQRELGDRAGLAGTLDSLGYIHHHQGHLAESAENYREAIRMYQEDSDRIGEANTRTRLATTLAEAGDEANAHGERTQALTILDDLDPAAAEALRKVMQQPDSPRA